MKRVLLDTNAVVWLFTAKKRHNLGTKAIHLIESSEIYISPLSFSEIAIKSMLGKMNEVSITPEELERAGVKELSFSTQHAGKMYDLQSLAKHDPFDRMLLAQALEEDMIFLTADRVLLDLSMNSVVDASL